MAFLPDSVHVNPTVVLSLEFVDSCNFCCCRRVTQDVMPMYIRPDGRSIPLRDVRGPEHESMKQTIRNLESIIHRFAESRSLDHKKLTKEIEVALNIEFQREPPSPITLDDMGRINGIFNQQRK